MKKLLFVSLLGLALAGCGDKSSSDTEGKKDGGESKSDDKKSSHSSAGLDGLREGNGNVSLGGTFHLAEEEPYTTLFPQAIEDLNSSKMANQIYEGLVKYNPSTLELEPAVAESYELSADGTEFTFKIRKGVKFHDNDCFEGGKGRELTANDVKYSIELMCSGDNTMAKSNFENTYLSTLEGAAAYNSGQADNISGVEVIDDYTLKLKLNAAHTSFIYKLALTPTAVIAKEAYEKYGSEIKVGSGPFKYVSETADGVVMARNENYYGKDADGNQLPYMDTVVFHFIDNKSEQVEMFENGQLHVLNGLPAESAAEIIQEKIDEYEGAPPVKISQFEPELACQYYEFNMTRKHFKDARVRKAFNYAVDRNKIIENVLYNQAHMSGNYGITPPVKILKDYPFDSIANYGYEYNPELAKELMAEAGYPNGEGFPTLELVINSGGNMHNKVAKEVTKQLRSVLGVEVNLAVVPFKQKLEDAKYGKADMFRGAWVADYPDPETFLTNFYGKNVPASLDEPSHPNTTRYKNATFDKYFEAALKSTDKESRYDNFFNAEKTMLMDPPIMVLWYAEDYKLYYSYVRNYAPNALQYLDLSRVYLKVWEKNECVDAH